MPQVLSGMDFTLRKRRKWGHFLDLERVYVKETKEMGSSSLTKSASTLRKQRKWGPFLNLERVYVKKAVKNESLS